VQQRFQFKNHTIGLTSRVANDELKHMDENLMENELVQQRERLIELEAAVAELSKNLKSHKQAQEDIRKSEEKYRNILDNVTDGIYMSAWMAI